MTPGKGEIKVNGQPFKDYLCRETLATIVMQPLVAVENEKAYNIDVNVNGGGLTGQAGAIRLGISRALLTVNGDYRSILKEKGFLTRDARKVERKKPGQPGARKNFQFSKR
jgi:small subunit ribosomal protein S9